MELKYYIRYFDGVVYTLLIVPYGIEISVDIKSLSKEQLLIVPYGIEIVSPELCLRIQFLF